MDRSPRRRRGARPAPLLAVLVLVVAACGATVAPSPSPTARPTPSPTPSPSADPVAGFLARAVDVQANGTAHVGGTVTAGAASGQVEGEFEFDGRDSHSRLAVTLGGTETTHERIERLGRAWERRPPGPWLVADDPPVEGQTLAETLEAIRSVDEVGVETRDGRTLHRLRPEVGAEVSPQAFGLDGEGIADPEIDLAVLVEPDGTPAVLIVESTWTQALGGTAVPYAMDLEFTFDEWNVGLAIQPPDDVWAVHTSNALGYSMARPEDWTVTQSDGQEVFGRDSAGFVYVAPQELTTALTTDQFRDAVAKASTTELGGPPESTQPTTLGDQAAYRLTYRTDDASGAKIVLVDYLTVRGKVGWEVYLVALAGDSEAADLAFFEAFIASFAFTD
jgi:hypothetical protein